jgi:hypothetical protein
MTPWICNKSSMKSQVMGRAVVPGTALLEAAAAAARLLLPAERAADAALAAVAIVAPLMLEGQVQHRYFPCWLNRYQIARL